MKGVLDGHVAQRFRDELRNARAQAFRDAEGFAHVLFAIERLGSFLFGEIGALGRYRTDLRMIAMRSPLGHAIGAEHPTIHPKFDNLFDLVLAGRNDAMHHGAAARHITRHAVELALILEDALMTIGPQRVREFMASPPICAELWQPVSFVRRTMLENAFSYLPVDAGGEERGNWKLVSDVALARYLRTGPAGVSRNDKLAATLGEVVCSGKLDLVSADTCSALDSAEEATSRFTDGRPLLVLRPEDVGNLLGLLSPFDLI